MWAWLANTVLRNRMAILIAVGIITVFLGWQGTRVQMSYKHGGLLPKTDSAYVDYERFLSTFSEDGNVMVVGTQGDALYTPDKFKAWYELGNDLKRVEGIDSVFSEAHLYELLRNDSLKRFDVEQVVQHPPTTQPEMDSLRAHLRSLRFYDNLLYNDSTQASLMMVFVNAKVFDSDARTQVVEQVRQRTRRFAEDTGMPMHVSGLPWIRVNSTELIKGEMPLFMGLSLFVCGFLLLLFFRSWRVMWLCLAVVALSVVWTFGCMALLDYKITILQSVIPPLVIVTGVPNCVFLINAYHYEFVRHGNKMKSLQRVISRIGAAAFMTNATTAVGFTTFCVTSSDTLVEFGWVATIGIMVLWVLSMLLIPIVFSYMRAPKPRHTSHLDRRWLDHTVEWIVRTSRNRRPLIYAITTFCTVLAFVGILRMKDESRIVDDLPKDNPVLTDLRFFEQNFRGVMPLEIIVDAKRKGMALNDRTLKRIERLNDTLATYAEFSRPLSIADAVKFTKQAFYLGDPERYELIKPNYPPDQFIIEYLEGADEKQDMARGFIDSTRQTARITVQMADVGTTRMDELLTGLRTQVDSIFEPVTYRVTTDSVLVGSAYEVRKDSIPRGYHVTFTGTSVVFLRGSSYLVDNLITSLFWAVMIIVLLMALLFSSVRILIVALIPNMIPLLFTAGLMGFFHIPIKPSTMLVFGIALGIAVDNAIHFLARYRLELKLTGGDLRKSVDLATREVSVGIIYTSVVLLAGFSLFAFSQFGGIRALGVLTTITLLVAMLTNLLVLPALLLSLNKRIMSKAFQEPLLEIMDEEEDIELMELKLDKPVREKEVTESDEAETR